MPRLIEQGQGPTNPANIKLTWKSSEKRFVSYNKITKTQELLGDISFICLEESVSVCGFNDPQQLGIFSNEIKDTTKEELTIRTKNGILCQGLYADIKVGFKNIGAQFASNVYIQLKTGEVAVLQLSGAALKSWFDFRTANNEARENHWVTIVGVQDQTKGKVKYSTPMFGLGVELTDDEDAVATSHQTKVKTFFKKLNAKSLEDVKETHEDEASDIPW